MQTSAATTSISSVCLTCGTITKSGKLSCCARGGSWFGNCGANGNTKLQHTWYEGMQACEARQIKIAVMGQQRNAVQQSNSNSSNDGDMNSRAAMVAAKILTSTSANAPIYGITPITVFPNTLIKTSPITSTRTIIDTSVSNTFPGGTFIAYNTDAIFYKQINLTGIHSRVNMSTRLQAIPQANLPITIPVNGPPANSIITKSGRVPMIEASTDMTPFYTSASASITVRQNEHSLSTITFVMTSLISVVW